VHFCAAFQVRGGALLCCHHTCENSVARKGRPVLAPECNIVVEVERCTFVLPTDNTLCEWFWSKVQRLGGSRSLWPIGWAVHFCAALHAWSEGLKMESPRRGNARVLPLRWGP
jgi:hypothetical protein